MKCIQWNTPKLAKIMGRPLVSRVPDDEAADAVKSGQAAYVPKRVWRAAQEGESHD